VSLVKTLPDRPHFKAHHTNRYCEAKPLFPGDRPAAINQDDNHGYTLPTHGNGRISVGKRLFASNKPQQSAPMPPSTVTKFDALDNIADLHASRTTN
jgi:hypothetical protein